MVDQVRPLSALYTSDLPEGASQMTSPSMATGTLPGNVALATVSGVVPAEEKDAPPSRLTSKVKVSVLVLVVALNTGRKISPP